MKIYNKLARDKAVHIMKATGRKASARILNEDEYITALRAKLQEEVEEFLTDDTVEELADILEVVHALAKTHHITPRELETIRASKARVWGEFRDRVFLEREE